MFFKKKIQSDKLNFEKMTPVEAVTYLFVFVMLSDNQGSYEEKESWRLSISKLFPDNLESRTEIFFNEANLVINKYKREIFLDNICRTINSLLNKEKIEKLGPMLNHLIESDGIIMSSEINATVIIEKKLNIIIRSNKNS